MSMDASQTRFLQRLVEDRPDSRRSGEMTGFFANEYGIGRVVGRSVIYSPQDWHAAAQLLDNHGIPREKLPGSLRRGETSAYTGLSEKSFGDAPHANSVAVRVASGDCRLATIPIVTPDGGYMVLQPADALAIQCDRMLVVENLDTFRFLCRYRWIDFRGLSTLVIYRGDRFFNTSDATRVIRARDEPVWAFFDFDPAGLALAAAIPRLERVVLPDHVWLRKITIESKRYDLFDKQVQQYAATLDGISHPDIASAWTMMKDLKRGYPQEWMEMAPS
ncbi:DUF7281 domain-containing protein [Paraburkholderia sp.]|jgi:hypothetical protein|uniref:DUF7281 domain-containing protein n=1 Tax=Paraburkholderia sp. TaxID=1926495 RepID=UPI003C7C2444